jgi:hypothetical protein
VSFLFNTVCAVLVGVFIGYVGGRSDWGRQKTIGTAMLLGAIVYVCNVRMFG